VDGRKISDTVLEMEVVGPFRLILKKVKERRESFGLDEIREAKVPRRAQRRTQSPSHGCTPA
jgi:hypothetical protein